MPTRWLSWYGTKATDKRLKVEEESEESVSFLRSIIVVKNVLVFAYVEARAGFSCKRTNCLVVLAIGTAGAFLALQTAAFKFTVAVERGMRIALVKFRQEFRQCFLLLRCASVLAHFDVILLGASDIAHSD
jgi:hypothetical protein